MSQGQDYFFKGALIGSPGVGKTSILNVLTGQKFQDNYLNTVGVDFKNLFYTHEGKSVKLQLWDTAGQEKFRSMSTMVYKGADLIIAVFDMTDQRTFHALLNDWLDEVSIYSEFNRCIIAIVGNKQDSNQRKIDKDLIQGSLKNSQNLYLLQSGTQIQQEKFGYFFEEVSAKTNFNVQQTIQKAIMYLAQRKKLNKINAKKDRDFGQSELIINGKNLESKIPKKNSCCKGDEDDDQQQTEDFLELDQLINPTGVDEFLYIAKHCKKNFPQQITGLYFKSFLHTIKRQSNAILFNIANDKDLIQFLRILMKRITKRGTDQEFQDLMILCSSLSKFGLDAQMAFDTDLIFFKQKFLTRIINGNYDLRSLLNINRNNELLSKSEIECIDLILLEELKVYEMDPKDSLIYLRLTQVFMSSSNRQFQMKIFRYIEDRSKFIQLFASGVQLKLISTFVKYPIWVQNTKIENEICRFLETSSKLDFPYLSPLLQLLQILIKSQQDRFRDIYIDNKQYLSNEKIFEICQSFFNLFQLRNRASRNYFPSVLQYFMILQYLKISYPEKGKQIDQLLDKSIKYFDFYLKQIKTKNSFKSFVYVDYLTILEPQYLPLKKNIQSLINIILEQQLQRFFEMQYTSCEYFFFMFFIADKSYAIYFFDNIHKKKRILASHMLTKIELLRKMVYVYHDIQFEQKIVPEKLQQQQKVDFWKIYPRVLTENQIKRLLEVFDCDLFIVLTVMYYQNVDCLQKGYCTMKTFQPFKAKLHQFVYQMQNASTLNLFYQYLLYQCKIFLRDQKKHINIPQIGLQLQEFAFLTCSTALTNLSSSKFYRLLYIVGLFSDQNERLKRIFYQSVIKFNIQFIQPLANKIIFHSLCSKNFEIFVQTQNIAISYQNICVHPYIVQNILQLQPEIDNFRIIFCLLIYYNQYLSEKNTNTLQKLFKQYLKSEEQTLELQQIEYLYKFYQAKKITESLKQKLSQLIQSSQEHQKILMANHLIRICVIKKQHKQILNIFRQSDDKQLYMNLFINSLWCYQNNDYIFEILETVFEEGIPDNISYMRFNYFLVSNRYLINFILEKKSEEVIQKIKSGNKHYRDIFLLEINDDCDEKLDSEAVENILNKCQDIKLDQAVNIIEKINNLKNIQNKQKLYDLILSKVDCCYFYNETFLYLIKQQLDVQKNLEFDNIVNKIQKNKLQDIYIQKFLNILKYYEIKTEEIYIQDMKFGTFLLNDFDIVIFFQDQNQYIQEKNKKQILEVCEQNFPNFQIYFYCIQEQTHVHNLKSNLENIIKQKLITDEQKIQKIQGIIEKIEQTDEETLRNMDFLVYYNPLDFCCFKSYNEFKDTQIQYEQLLQNLEFSYSTEKASDDLEYMVYQNSQRYFRNLSDNIDPENQHRIEPQYIGQLDEYTKAIFQGQTDKKIIGWKEDQIFNDVDQELQLHEYDYQQNLFDNIEFDIDPDSNDFIQSQQQQYYKYFKKQTNR